jgi:hypothetical protein
VTPCSLLKASWCLKWHLKLQGWRFSQARRKQRVQLCCLPSAQWFLAFSGRHGITSGDKTFVPSFNYVYSSIWILPWMLHNIKYTRVLCFLHTGIFLETVILNSLSFSYMLNVHLLIYPIIYYIQIFLPIFSFLNNPGLQWLQFVVSWRHTFLLSTLLQLFSIPAML